MAEKRSFEIFVRNAQDEYITTVVLMTGRDGNGPSALHSLTSSLPSKCVVVDYTRDVHVLGTRAGYAGALTMVSVKDHDKLKSFRGYLAGRKKAGVVQLPAGGSFFLLPSANDACLQGENIIGLVRQADGVVSGGSHGGTGLGARPSNQALAAASIVAPRPTGAGSGKSSGKSSGSCSAGGAGIGGFLGSLMGTLSQTHDSVADTAAVDRVNRAQEQAIRKKVERFKVEVREKLEAFATDPAAISHEFPFVEKSLRSIQHGLAEDFDGITSRTEGEVDDRHVVVYKLGYEPPEEEAELDAQVHVPVARKSSPTSSVSLAPMPAITVGGSGGGGGGPGAADLVRIGTVVKDRRTVQDIEEETRQAKRRRVNGDIGADGK